jgi:hypothetical protein
MSAPNTFKARDEWMRAILADKALSPQAKLIAIRLALHLNIKTGRCNPTYDRLAKGTAYEAQRYVRRIVAQLVAAGWVEIATSRGRHANGYRLKSPANQGLPGPCSTRASQAPVETPTRASQALVNQGLPGPPEKRSEKRSKKEDIYPGVVAPLGAHPPEEEDAFETFWQQFPHRRNKPAARKAYAGVIDAKQATADELLAGAMAYAAYRDGQDSQFTKQPANWLRDEGWRDDYSPAAQPAGWVEIAMGGMRRDHE